MKHLAQQSSLVKLKQEAELYQALLSLAQQALPDTLAPQLVGIAIEQPTLICLVNQANWASKIRFFEQALLQHFNQNLPHLQLNRVKFKIHAAPTQAQPRTKRQANRPDSDSAQAFAQLSQQVQSPKLARALAKLSQRAEPSD